jgi:ferredoxin-NADP reductase
MSSFRTRPLGGQRGFWAGPATETTVVSSHRITPSTHEIVLAKPEGFDFLPVQFTFLTLMTDQGPDTRPMSLATSPTRPNLEYGVRISDSPYKRAFASLKPGDTVQIQGPYGDFVIDEKRPALLVAGGIGITPLKGMAEYAADKKLEIPIRLLYSNRTKDDIAYRARLEELERQNPRFRVLHTLTSEPSPKDWAGLRGRIRPELLRKATEGLGRTIYYLSGKPSLVSTVLGMLESMGVQEDDVRIEVFRGYWS